IIIKGKIMQVACWLYSDSEIINPAMKAPKARDKPASDVKNATAKQMVMVVNKKSSLLLVFAMAYISLGTTYLALKMVITMTTTDLTKSNKILEVTLVLSPAMIGVKSIMGTTMIS